MKKLLSCLLAAMLLCGLCTDMKVLIMDEPSNGLDIESQMPAVPRRMRNPANGSPKQRPLT